MAPTERRYKYEVRGSSDPTKGCPDPDPDQDIDFLSQDIAAAALKLLQTSAPFSALPVSYTAAANSGVNVSSNMRDGGTGSTGDTGGSGGDPSGRQDATLLNKMSEALLARPPCRFETFPMQVRPPPLPWQTSAAAATGVKKVDTKVKVDVVLDIAHNVAAVQALVAKVRLFYPNTPIR